MDDVATAPETLERGRAAYTRRAWQDAHTSLSAADRLAPLGAPDLELLATAAYMLGRVDDFLKALERAHAAYLAAGERLPGSRCAFFLGVNLFLLGETGRGSAWLGRAHRLVEAEGRECVERGYLLMPVAMQNEAAGDYAAAAAAAASAAEIGRQFGEGDLCALALQSQGRILIKQSRLDEGLALLDEAMLAASGDELSPIVTGIVYCGVIEGCEQAYELRRAREWTGALSRWCEEQPQMVAFGGRCLVHRSGIMRLDGAWSEALEEARRGRERAERAANPAAAGEALYQQGQILRLQGELAAAEAAYREANRCGREPQPGLALLRLAQGDGTTAASVAQRALTEAAAPLDRARILPAFVEIALAVGDGSAARAAADELTAIATSFGSGMLHALAADARGAVELVEGDARAALMSLRRALQEWQELGAPYESARTRVLLAQACRLLGDEETAAAELDEARAVFTRLGAVPDVVALDAGGRAAAPQDAGLTERELEVLRLVARGQSNRQIAATLVVSEHTVARHIQNMFRKLGVSSRAAATAYAFERHLV